MKTIFSLSSLIAAFALSILLMGCKSDSLKPAENQSVSAVPKTFSAFQAEAAKFNSVLTLPELEKSADAIKLSLTNTIKEANASLDEIGALKPVEVSFGNTIRTLDDISYRAGLFGNRLSLTKETSTNAAMRAAATDAIKVFQDWAVGLDYREDVYAAVKAFAATKPKLSGEDKKLFEETMRDYRRAGLELPKEKRDEVERLRKEVSKLTTDFETNITDAKKAVKFSKTDLAGVPEDFLKQKGIKTGDNEYTVMANITFHYLLVLENCKVEATRKKFQFEHDNMAVEKNVPLLKQILKLRNDIAHKLGYASWADFQIEPKMAKNAKTATDFLEKLKVGLQPKFDAEVGEYQKLKAKETGEANAKINLWDWRYYANQLKKEKYTVDAEALRVYFSYDRVLHGMFDIYQSIFGLKFHEIEAPYKWIGDLKLFAVTDAKTGEPMGLFYLDMFPRDGKYNHFAQFGIIEGKLLPGGKYQRPTVALICNFPPPDGDKPSLLSHQEVETLFHEFGHAMHSVLTRANYGRFAGTSVPRDFVEAPSQMLENWVWDKDVLDSFAADYRNPTNKIPPTILAKLKESKLATEGTRYRRQLSFGLTDLKLHSSFEENEDVVKISNDVIADVFFPPVEGSAYVGYFGHLMGYDAGYYGYAWADAIAADMATVFEKSKRGYFDKTVGMRLRNEIYAVGNSRDVNVSIQNFLGRKQSLEPFLESIGISKAGDKQP
ncbi:MAG: M3 family metallopeptidase [Verrucomicrobiota bacterium]